MHQSSSAPTTQIRSLPRPEYGFSLIEVVMALGIFAFAIVGIIALMPIALKTHMDAKIQTVQTQIGQRLAAEALLTDYSQLMQLDQKIRYFNGEGVEVSNPPANGERPIVFTSKTVIAAVTLPSSYSPGSSKNVIFYAIHDPGVKGVTGSVKPTGSILIANTSPSF